MEADEYVVHYEKRYAAFIDILGFSELVRSFSEHQECGNCQKCAVCLGTEKQRSEARAGKIEALVSVLRSALRITSEDAEYVNLIATDIQTSCFSDCIFISGRSDPVDLHYVLEITARVCRSLLSHGYMTRGAVAAGPLYHSGGVVMGQGLITAYDLERKYANYPRILIAPDCLALVKEMSRARIEEDFDGVHYLNYLSQEAEPKEVLVLDKIRRVLEEQLSHKDIGVRAKTRWMAALFNNHAHIHRAEKLDLS